MERLSIRIPPGTAHVASVRAFVGAVGRTTGCSEEAVDDLRLVATEACAQAIEQDAPPAVIEVRSLVDGGRLLVEIEPCGRFDRAPEGLDGDSGRATRRALIEGLFPDAEFDDQVLRVAVPIARA
jgi:anti-sigma regulatory factor (Ser/Thr protein kinase)